MAARVVAGALYLSVNSCIPFRKQHEGDAIDNAARALTAVPA
ncbi:hypothetical protein [Klebsiella pneumoniae]